MAVPVFWNTAFRYLEVLAVIDVNTIISNVSSELVAGGWSDASGVGTGPWTSPARADGIRWKITLARVSATRLQVTVHDQNGMQVTDSAVSHMDIEATGCSVQIFTGALHFCVNAARPTPECMWAGVLDQYPDSMLLPKPMYVSSNGARNSSGTWQSAGWDGARILRPSGTAYATMTAGIVRIPPVSARRYTLAGTLLFSPAEYGDQTNYMFLGRLPMAITVPDALAWGAEITVPLDANTTGVFKVVGPVSSQYQKMAFRKS
jgi:hypothetical protein